MNDDIWNAIITCNPSYDDKFFYGVNTTGIFCRPSCKSKNPKKQNVTIFTTIQEATAANFRPCKRCRPDQSFWPDEEIVQKAKDLIESRYHEVLTLQHLSGFLHISPYHLHRVFKRITGQTPLDFLRATRLQAATKLLQEKSRTIMEIAITVGFSNPGHFTTVFQKQFGMTPSAFRSR